MDFKDNIWEIHIGEIIEKKLEENPMTKADFADMINRERSTVYDILIEKVLTQHV